MKWSPRCSRYDVTRRHGHLGSGRRDQIDHDPRGVLTIAQLCSRDAVLEAAECEREVFRRELCLDATHPSRSLCAVEACELLTSLLAARTSRRRHGEIAERRRDHLFERLCLRARCRAGCERSVEGGHELRLLGAKAREVSLQLGPRQRSVAHGREVAFAPHIEHARSPTRSRQRLVDEHGSDPVDDDALLPRSDADVATTCDRRAIFEHRDRDDREEVTHDSLRLPPTSSCLPAILIS